MMYIIYIYIYIIIYKCHGVRQNICESTEQFQPWYALVISACLLVMFPSVVKTALENWKKPCTLW